MEKNRRNFDRGNIHITPMPTEEGGTRKLSCPQPELESAEEEDIWWWRGIRLIFQPQLFEYKLKLTTFALIKPKD